MAILILAHPTACTEVAYAVGPDGEEPVGYANITEYKGTEVISFTTSISTIAPPTGPSTGNKTVRAVDSIKDEINKKIDIDNPSVRDEALRLVGKGSGAQRIDQICSIYDYMVGNWIFVSDPRGGSDLYQYSNYTLKRGREFGGSGKGDCDDFSILLASLVDSIGGTPRIVLAYSPDTGGHAYTEVYLGKKNDRDVENVERMQKWLKTTYNVNTIYIHEDLGSGDLWLNMDWWKAPDGANHPGGPFYKANLTVPIFVKEGVGKTPLTPIENKPPRPHFTYSPLQPEVDELVRFDASGSIDPDGEIVDYEWDFGDDENAHGITKSICRHSYSSSGNFPVSLTVRDNEEDQSTTILDVDVKEPLPEITITYYPEHPNVGDLITFDASQSKDKRGQIIGYEWDFDDGNKGYKVQMKHRYEDSGAYKVKLTVTNDKGATNSKFIDVVVEGYVYTTGGVVKQLNHDLPIATNETAVEVSPGLFHLPDGQYLPGV